MLGHVSNTTLTSVLVKILRENFLDGENCMVITQGVHRDIAIQEAQETEAIELGRSW